MNVVKTQVMTEVKSETKHNYFKERELVNTSS